MTTHPPKNTDPNSGLSAEERDEWRREMGHKKVVQGPVVVAPGRVPVAVRRRKGEQGRRGKVSPEVLQRLGGGEFSVVGRVDLHMHNCEEARQRLGQFLGKEHGGGCVLVITGKGKHSAGGAVLKPMVEELLSNDSRVRAFCPALSRDGGDGAFYVLLR